MKSHPLCLIHLRTLKWIMPEHCISELLVLPWFWTPYRFWLCTYITANRPDHIVTVYQCFQLGLGHDFKQLVLTNVERRTKTVQLTYPLQLSMTIVIRSTSMLMTIRPVNYWLRRSGLFSLLFWFGKGIRCNLFSVMSILFHINHYSM
jgi:hypothetical protein